MSNIMSEFWLGFYFGLLAAILTLLWGVILGFEWRRLEKMANRIKKAVKRVKRGSCASRSVILHLRNFKNRIGRLGDEEDKD